MKPDTITINGSHGEVVASAETGAVLEHTHVCDCEDCNANGYRDILRFDVGEYTLFWGRLDGNLDVCDIGFWTDKGIYEPPIRDHRLTALVDFCDGFEVDPIVILEDGTPEIWEEELAEQGYSIPSYYSLFMHLRGGGRNCLGDYPTEEAAQARARELERLIIAYVRAQEHPAGHFGPFDFKFIAGEQIYTEGGQLTEPVPARITETGEEVPHDGPVPRD